MEFIRQLLLPPEGVNGEDVMTPAYEGQPEGLPLPTSLQ